MAAHWTENTRALKLLVGVMTALLVVGLIVLVIGMARTAGRMSAQVGDREVELPAGSELVGITAGDGRLYLDVRLADGRRDVLLVDPKTGKRLGSLQLRAAP